MTYLKSGNKVKKAEPKFRIEIIVQKEINRIGYEIEKRSKITAKIAAQIVRCIKAAK